MRTFARPGVLAAFVFAMGYAAPAGAVELELLSESSPHPGVTLQSYRASAPATDVWVARVELCAPGVEVRATRAPSSLQSVSSWGQDAGVHVAINGDFYKTGPVRVYGRAIGEGAPWPSEQTGLDPDYESEWYYKKFGYFAFGHDRVDYSHTKWVKNHAELFTLVDGWANDTVAAEPPLGTLALVSGFSQLVVEGEVITCVTPTDSGCFPDRSDMRQRHPRSAVGVDAEGETLLMVVVDGRTQQNAGMYGAELAEVMGLLDAHVAFNFDGGGSSQLWVKGEGTVNNASGNNYGNGNRAVANHLGVYVGGEGRPAHCASAPPCELIPPPGATLDDLGECFGAFGPSEYWRTEPVGFAEHLHWTNAFQSSVRSNWAWWRLEFEEAGEYELEYLADPEFSVFSAATYLVVADGVAEERDEDLGAASGWRSLGTYSFAAGGDQYVAVMDDHTGPVAADQHIAADAVRVTRIGGYCGDHVCDPDESCSSCAADCPPILEQPDNGVDDDCDGEIDEPGPATTTDGDSDTDSDTDSDGDSDSGTASGSDSAAPGDSASGLEGTESAASESDADAGGALDDAEGCGCRAADDGSNGDALLLLGLALCATRRRRDS